MPMPAKAFRFRVMVKFPAPSRCCATQAAMGLDMRPERIDMPYARPEQAAAYETYWLPRAVW